MGGVAFTKYPLVYEMPKMTFTKKKKKKLFNHQNIYNFSKKLGKNVGGFVLTKIPLNCIRDGKKKSQVEKSEPKNDDYVQQHLQTIYKTSTGPRSAVGNVSGYRCVSDCRSRGREFDPGPVPYFRGD